MTHNQYTRILALEVRSRKLGFAAIESRRLLLDYGVRTYRSPKDVLRCLKPLLSVFAPCIVIVRRARHRNSQHRTDVTTALRVIREECARRSISVEVITVHEVRWAFRQMGRIKEHIADAVAHAFPELHWKLPPKRHRRPWIGEGWNEVLFDAAGAGLAYFARSEQTEEPNPN